MKNKIGFITLIIILANIAMFVIMTLQGVSITDPTIQNLVDWGANSKSITMEGQWWRLISSIFLHIGIVHILVNLYALLYIGFTLEKIIGKSRFFAAYMITGISGSIASIYWHDNVVSAGASGAIFGLYGLFLALLTTNLIEEKTRKDLMSSIVVFIGYNLLYGLTGGVDNAAHIGGLISGIVIGYLYYPSLIKSTSNALKYSTILGLVMIFTISFYAALINFDNSKNQWHKDIELFAELEEEALKIYNMPEFTTSKVILFQIENVGIVNWKKAIDLLGKYKDVKLHDEMKERNDLLLKYLELRLLTYELARRAIKEDTKEYDKLITEYDNQTEDILEKFRSKDPFYIDLSYLQAKSEDTATVILLKNLRLAKYNEYIVKGNELSNKNDIDGAIREYKKAVEMYPELETANYNLGLAYMNKPKPDMDKAIIYLKQSVKIEPEFADSYLKLAIIYAIKGDEKTGLDYLKKAARLGSEHAQDVCKESGIKW